MQLSRLISRVHTRQNATCLGRFELPTSRYLSGRSTAELQTCIAKSYVPEFQAQKNPGALPPPGFWVEGNVSAPSNNYQEGLHVRSDILGRSNTTTTIRKSVVPMRKRNAHERWARARVCCENLFARSIHRARDYTELIYFVNSFNEKFLTQD